MLTQPDYAHMIETINTHILSILCYTVGSLILFIVSTHQKPLY